MVSPQTPLPWFDVPTPAAAPTAATPASTLAQLRNWAEAGWLRRLDAELAAFMAQADPAASPALLLATALLAQLEGRGHTCLPLTDLAQPPLALLAWPPAGEAALQQAWPTQPTAAWATALAASRCVRCLPHQPDTGQPLVLADAHASPAAAAATGPRLYLRRYWLDETGVAASVRQRCAAQATAGQGAATLPAPLAPLRQWLDRLFAPAEPAAPDWQKLACAIALRSRFAVITGGPGTGKTYTAARLLAALLATAEQPETLRVGLAAPTGKAAARLKQSIDRALTELQARVGPELDLAGLNARIAARTLHALLGARPETRAFRHNARHPLDLDVLIVDEASMVHLEMMAALLAALPPQARLVLLGDKDQLASVEAGAVLGDLCRNAEAGSYTADTAAYALAAAGVRLPPAFLHPTQPASPAPVLAQHTVMLRESRRFSGPIGQLAQAENQGNTEAARRLLAAPTGPLGTQLGPTGPQAAVHLALHGRPGAEGGYRSYLRLLADGPQANSPPCDSPHTAWVKAVLQAFDRFRLLCAVREGEWGANSLNRTVAQALAHDPARLLHPEGEWYAGRPVMVTRNDPALGVFNGDIGITLPATPPTAHAPAGPLRVWFLDGDTLRSVACSRLAHAETAFAMTVHKSQGSEFDHTVLVLPPQSAGFMGRELVYTGITRARSAFTLVAPHRDTLLNALARPTHRASGLATALGQGAQA